MRLLSILIVIISIIGCKTEPIYRVKCYARYLEEEHKLQTKVEVRNFKQTEVAAIKVNEVRFNDGTMERRDNQVVGHYYQAERSGYPANGFEYKINNGKENGSVAFKIPAFDKCTLKDLNISKSKGFTITWSGEPLKREEEITVNLVDSLGVTAQAIVKGATAKSEATIPAVMYSGLSLGKASYYLVKTTLPAPTTKNVEAEVELGYYTKTQTVNIVE